MKLTKQKYLNLSLQFAFFYLFLFAKKSSYKKQESMKLYFLTAVVSILLLFCACKMDVRVEGLILDAGTNKPVPHAEVTCNENSQVSQSDSTGAFVCGNVAAHSAKINLTVKKEGYTTVHCEIDLGDERPLVIKLKK